MMINGEIGIIPGPWHMPDWGLIQAKQTHPEADFVPFAIENESGDGKINALSTPGTGQYIVVKKGFEHPEKIAELVKTYFC